MLIEGKEFVCDNNKVCKARLALPEDEKRPYVVLIESGWGFHEHTGLTFCPRCAEILKI